MSLEGHGPREPSKPLPSALRRLIPSAMRRDGPLREEGLPTFLQFLVDQGLSEERVANLVRSGKTKPHQVEPHIVPVVGKRLFLVALSSHFRVEAVDLESANVSYLVARIVPVDVGRPCMVGCVDADEDGLTLAMVDPGDEAAVRLVEARTDFKVKRRIAVLKMDLDVFQDMLYEPLEMLPVSPRDIVDDILKQAIRMKASDIHIEPQEDDIRVRFRKDGILAEFYDLSKIAPKKLMIHHLKSSIPVVVKNKSGSSGKTMDIAEVQKPQDGRIYLPGRHLDMRVSILPSAHGESVVIRIHQPDEDSQDLARLGFSERDLSRLLPMIESPYGMIIVSGPTGSGKTTTLYTMLRRLNSPEKKILTVEDPIEYNIPEITQVQTNRAKGLTFAQALRSFLRHDPDVIMVGEIRDQETAVLAVEASLTGHLVLSTVHANDSVRTITRLRDLGVNPMLINSTCLGTLAQRLVRTNCPECSEPARFSARFREVLERYRVECRQESLRAGRGCKACNDTGYLGRTVICELMVMTPEIQQLVLGGGSDHEIQETARLQGMRLLVEDALEKAAAGLTTEDEVLRVTLSDASEWMRQGREQA